MFKIFGIHICVLWIQKGYFVVERLLLIVGSIAFWYLNNILYLIYLGGSTKGYISFKIEDEFILAVIANNTPMHPIFFIGFIGSKYIFWTQKI